MTKKEMLEMMENTCWEHDLDENSTYEEVEKEYLEMCDEMSEDMCINGRDYEAQDEDGV